MERKIVVASHGDAANGICDSVKMILGVIQADIEVFTLRPGQSAQSYAQHLEEEIKQYPEKEFLILTDVYGASVCSAMYSLIDYENVYVFTGMNVVMLLSVCLDYPNGISQHDAMKIVEDARAGIRWLKKEEAKAEEF